MNSKTNFAHRDAFILRAPFLSVDAWQDYRRHATQLDDGSGHWHSRAASARKLFQHPRINEAIYLASPGLHTRMQAIEWQMEAESGKKLLLAFERYLNRMCFRSTPFGLFSTVAHGNIGPDISDVPAAFAGNNTALRQARIDAALLHKLCDQVTTAHRAELCFLSNRSVYASKNSLKYTDWVATARNGRNYQLSEVDAHPMVLAALELCSEEPATMAKLGEALCARHQGLESDVAQALLADMADARLLLPTLSIDLQSNDSAREFVAQIATLRGAQSLHQTLSSIIEELDALNAYGEIDLVDYRRLSTKLLQTVSGKADQPALRVDSFRRSKRFTLDSQYCDNLITDFDLLISRFSERDGSFDGLAQRFEQYYGKGAVPLTEFLENEMLSGSDDYSYTHELLRQFGIDTPVYDGSGVAVPPVSFYDQFLVGKLLQQQGRNDNHVLRISRTEVEALRSRGKDLPDNLFAIMTVLNRPAEAQGPHTWLQGMSHSNIGAWIGRFAYGDVALDSMLKDMANQHQINQPEYLHAEICYRPADHIANIMTRPEIWPYRINLVEGDSKPVEQEITLIDIMVTVIDGELQLWSKKFGKRIVPHMSSAHNAEHSNSIKAYTLLRNLGRSRHIAHFGWSGFFTNYPFLPRIEFENIILAPARWLVEALDFPLSSAASVDESLQTFSVYLTQRGVPNLVELKEADNTLLLDRRDAIDLEQIFRIFKRGRRLVLREVVSCTEDADGAPIRHEVLLPFGQRGNAVAPIPVSMAVTLARDLPTAAMSEVVYAKIYLQTTDTDGFLVGQCTALIQRLRDQGLMRDWFFIRYADPEHHLRLRICMQNVTALPQVMSELVSMLEQQQSDGVVRHFAFAPYERELMRYGGSELMALSEQLFCCDSDMALALLPWCEPGDENRIQAAIWSSHALLMDGAYDLPTRHRIVSQLAKGYRAEFRISGFQRDLLGKYFRRHSAVLLRLEQQGLVFPAWAKNYERTTAHIRQRRAALFTQSSVDTRQVSFEPILQSHLHMTCIRLFVNHPRGYEVLVYDALERIYRAALGRSGRLKAVA